MRCIELIKSSPSVTTLDITGGAPELNAQFRPLVEAISALNESTGRNVEVIDRYHCSVAVQDQTSP